MFSRSDTKERKGDTAGLSYKLKFQELVLQLSNSWNLCAQCTKLHKIRVVGNESETRNTISVMVHDTNLECHCLPLQEPLCDIFKERMFSIVHSSLFWYRPTVFFGIPS